MVARFDDGGYPLLIVPGWAPGCWLPAPHDPMPDAPSPLAALADPTLLRTDALINGAWVPGSGRFDVDDPATGLRLATVANLGPADAEAAIAAANTAW